MSTVIGALRVTLGLDSSELLAGLGRAQASLKGFGQQMRDIGGDLSLRITAPLAAMGTGVLAVAGNFEAAMNRVEAATGASADEMAAMSDLARELGKNTTFSAGEAAAAIEMLAKNGLDAGQILGGALSASLDLAAAGGAELASAADLTTDILANFKKDISDLGPVVDGVSGVLLASKFGFDDYRLALAQAGGVAGGLGVTFEDFNAVIAATSPAFASGSDAGTSFKTFLQRLVPASDGAASAMEQLGLEFFTASGAMKSMPEIAQELQDALSKLSDEEKTEALSTIFGTDAMRTAIGLMDQGAAGVERLDAAIRKASAAEQAAARTKGFYGALEQLKGAAEELGLAIADAGLLDWATQLVQRLTALVDRISEADPALVRLGTVIGIAAAATGPLLVGLGMAAIAIGSIGAPVAAAVLAIGGLAAAGVVLYQNWDSIREQFPAIAGVAENLGGALLQLGRGALDQLKLTVQGIEQLFQGDLSGAAATGVQILTNMGEGIALALGAAFGFSEAEVRGFVDRVDAWLGQFGERVAQEFEGAKEGIAAFTADVGAGIDNFISSLSGLRDDFVQIGRDILDGLLAGLREKWEAVKGWFSGTADTIAQTVRDRLGIQSPSTVFAEIGRNIVQGLGVGIDEEAGAVKARLEALNAEMIGIFGEPRKDGAAGKSSSGAEEDPSVGVIQGLQLELALLERTKVEREIVNQARQAGVSILSEEGTRIADLVTRNAELNAEMDRVSAVNGYMASAFTDLWSSAAQGAGDFKDALGDIAGELGKMALSQAFQTIFNGPASAGGGGFFGGLGNVLSSVFGIGKIPAFANGTNFAPGGLSMVGERGRELVRLPRGSQVFSNRDTMAMLQKPEPQQIGLSLVTRMDKNGDMMTFVENVAGARVDAARAGIVGESVQAVRTGAEMSSHFIP